MALDIVVLLGSLGLILVGCELFTNGVEWVGFVFALGEGVVGSVLAAVGTAMPETLIPVIAILFASNAAGEEIGIGAILGAPFMLSTLAMFVTGTAVLIFSLRGRRSTDMKVNTTILRRDVSFFLVAYSVAIGAGFLPPSPFRVALALALVGMYGAYVLRQLADEGEAGKDLNPLHFAKLRGSAPPEPVAKELVAEISPIFHEVPVQTPGLAITLLQVAVGLVFIIGGARFFVGATENLAHLFGIPAVILALIVAPVATELPEKFNSVIWVRVRKDTLAIGNITGAMVFQSCIPTAIGISLTSWSITGTNVNAFVSAGIAIASSIVIFGIMTLKSSLNARWLLVGGAWYAVYLAFLWLA